MDLVTGNSVGSSSGDILLAAGSSATVGSTITVKAGDSSANSGGALIMYSGQKVLFLVVLL